MKNKNKPNDKRTRKLQPGEYGVPEAPLENQKNDPYAGRESEADKKSNDRPNRGLPGHERE